MKQVNKIAFCGIIAALSVIFMMVSYFPYLTYAVPAFSGLLIMSVVIEIDNKWALGTYLVSAVIIFLLAEPESKLLYIFLFGYYPIVKGLIEKINKLIPEWILKLLVFNIAVLVVYLLFSTVFDISLDDFDIFGKYGAFVFLAIGNVVFVMYDIAVSKMATLYLYLIHPKTQKFLK